MTLLVPIVAGWPAGYFLAVHVLVIITALCFIVGIIMSVKFKEMESLITLIYAGAAILGNVTMWLTYYFVADQTFVGKFIHEHILR